MASLRRIEQDYARKTMMTLFTFGSNRFKFEFTF
jgi:hypothetical protein